MSRVPQLEHFEAILNVADYSCQIRQVQCGRLDASKIAAMPIVRFFQCSSDNRTNEREYSNAIETR